MKKYLVIAFSTFLSLYAADSPDNNHSEKEQHTQEQLTQKEQSPPKDIKNKDILEIRAAYFFFTEEYAGRIYPPGSLSLELENNYWFYPSTSVWANVNFTWASGSPPHSNNTRTHMNISCLSAGIKGYSCEIKENTFLFYLGCGLSAALILTKDETPYLPTHLGRFSPGIVAKSGILILPYQRLAIDIFFDYYFQPVPRRIDLSFWNTLADVGGFRTGLGLGYLF